MPLLNSRTEKVMMPDGGQMDAHLALPHSGRGPGVLVLMEIYGVGTYIRKATERLADLGYVALAPDLYRRIAPGVGFDHDEEGLKQALTMIDKLDVQGAVEDAYVALEHMRTLRDVEGPICVLGFCLGGTLAYHLAAHYDPAAAVCYYGSGIADALDLADRIECPMLFHFGAEDAYIPIQDAGRVCEEAERHTDWECAIQPDGGHAFDNHEAPMFSRPEAAARAWQLTRDFLQRTLRR